MRARKVDRETLATRNACTNAAVCLQVVLRDDTDKKRAFCVPLKHEHRRPSRQDTHMMETSAFPAPERSTIARDRDDESPTTRAVTGEGYFPICRRDGSPQVRRMQAAKVSTT